MNAYAFRRPRLREPALGDSLRIRLSSVVKQQSGPHGHKEMNIGRFSRQARHPGDNRARTGNLRRAKAALSQLSYVPVARTPRPEPARPAGPIAAVGLARIELATSRLSGVRSNHLSYRPAEATGGDARLRLGSLQRKPRKRNAKAADTCRTDLE